MLWVMGEPWVGAGSCGCPSLEPRGCYKRPIGTGLLGLVLWDVPSFLPLHHQNSPPWSWGSSPHSTAGGMGAGPALTAFPWL